MRCISRIPCLPGECPVIGVATMASIAAVDVGRFLYTRGRLTPSAAEIAAESC